MTTGSDLKKQDPGQVLQSVYDNVNLLLKVSNQNSLIKYPYDYVSAAYPTTSVEVYTYRLGGVSGTIVAVATVQYTDDTKEVLSSFSVV